MTVRKYAFDANANGFKCPSCGGSWYYTSNTTLNAIKYGGHPVACKDEFGTGCKWRGLMRRPARPSRGGA